MRNLVFGGFGKKIITNSYFIFFLMFICDPFWENLPICTDNFFSDLLIKAKRYRLPFVWCIIRRYTHSGFDDIAT